MKKLYFLLAVLAAFGISAQSAFQIKDVDNGNTIVVNNQVFTKTTTPSAAGVAHHIEIKNVSATTHSFVMRKFENLINTVSGTDMASAYFCFNTFCFIPTTLAATIALTPNETFNFYPKLDEATVVGESNIVYEFSDMNNGSDALNMEFRYNPPVGLKENATKFSSISAVYPNPAVNKASIEINAEKEMNDVSVKIYNSLGSIVQEKKADLAKGKNSLNIDASSLESGIYFVSLGSGNNKSVKKLIITK
jgi:hypothetical protein